MENMEREKKSGECQGEVEECQGEVAGCRDYYLWVDDCKNPEEEFLCKGKLVCWAKDVDQAIFYVKHNGIPKIMFLDYDLGESCVMKFLRWMKMIRVPCDFDYKIISWNPCGCKEIIAFMADWKNNTKGFDK